VLLSYLALYSSLNLYFKAFLSFTKLLFAIDKGLEEGLLLEGRLVVGRFIRCLVAAITTRRSRYSIDVKMVSLIKCILKVIICPLFWCSLLLNARLYVTKKVFTRKATIC
jgi:hypothetical protein